MNLGIIALSVLVLIIVIAFVTKLNIGLLAIVAAVILGYISGQFSQKEIIGGFGASLFLTLLGVSLLFGVLNENGSLELLISKIINKVGKQIWVIPIVLYFIGVVVAGIGPGAIPGIAFVCIITIPIAHKTGYNPVMLVLIGELGTFTGRFTSLTPEGLLFNTVMGNMGFESALPVVLFDVGICTALLAILVFIFYKGYKVRVDHAIEKTQTERFTQKHIITLIGVLVMLYLSAFVRMNAGLASFLVSVALFLLRVGDEKKAMKSVPWNTLMMVTGVGVLMNIVIESGGIDILASGLSSIMTTLTAPALMCMMSGIMSWFSSALGVVYPTLLPTVGPIFETLNSAVPSGTLAAMIGMGATLAAVSPASTGGALLMAAIQGDDVYSKKWASNALFIESFVWSIAFVVLAALLSFVGLYSIVR